jgi:hypothetical protein
MYERNRAETPCKTEIVIYEEDLAQTVKDTSEWNWVVNGPIPKSQELENLDLLICESGDSGTRLSEVTLCEESESNYGHKWY